MNLQEQISRMKSMMGVIKEGYLGSCVEVGDEDSHNFINQIFYDATQMAYYVGNPDEDEWGRSVEISKKEFFNKIDKEFVNKKQLKGDVVFYYIPDLDIYFIYNSDKDIHYFYKE